MLSFTFGPEDIPDLEAAAVALQDYVDALLEARRSAPRDDLLSRFLAEAEAAGELTPQEVVPDRADDRRRHRHDPGRRGDAGGLAAAARSNGRRSPATLI